MRLLPLGVLNDDSEDSGSLSVVGFDRALCMFADKAVTKAGLDEARHTTGVVGGGCVPGWHEAMGWPVSTKGASPVVHRSAEQIRVDRDAKIEALQTQLADAVGGLVTGSDWIAAMKFAARFRSRSFANTMLIGLQHAAAHDAGQVPDPIPTTVAGFKQWQTLGRSVMKGQSGYMIQAPVTARMATSTPSDVESWRRLGRGEKPRPGEVARSRMVGVKPAYVWDVSQTDGKPIPQRPRPVLLAGQAPSGLQEGLVELIGHDGFTVGIVADAGVLGGANGITNFTDRTVGVRGDMDDAARVKTLAHELAHIELGHEDRRADGLHRGIGEVEAESVAMMITAAWGLDSTAYTVPYVSGWASSVAGADPLAVVRATGERVRATAVQILNRLPAPPIGDGRPPGLQPTTAARPVLPAGLVQPDAFAAVSLGRSGSVRAGVSR